MTDRQEGMLFQGYLLCTLPVHDLILLQWLPQPAGSLETPSVPPTGICKPEPVPALPEGLTPAVPKGLTAGNGNIAGQILV